MTPPSSLPVEAVVAPSWWPADWRLGDATHPRWHGGGCMALALALHDLSGWLMYELHIQGSHYVLKTPEGLMLDHEGARPWPRHSRGVESVSRTAVAKAAAQWGPLKDFPDAPAVAAQLLSDYRHQTTATASPPSAR